MIKQLAEIQRTLKVPKGQYNSFGKYRYRSCEDILESVKPLLGESALTISDEIIQVGDRYYVKATATLEDASGKSVSNSAFAREDTDKKGMDGSQITGTASSYARKYALNGLFCIDDTKDADTDEHANEIKPATTLPQKAVEKTETTAEDIARLRNAVVVRFGSPEDVKAQAGVKAILAKHSIPRLLQTPRNMVDAVCREIETYPE